MGTQNNSMCWYWEQRHICDYFHPRGDNSSPFIPSGRSSWRPFQVFELPRKIRIPTSNTRESLNMNTSKCRLRSVDILTPGVAAEFLSKPKSSPLQFPKCAEESRKPSLQHLASRPPLLLRWSVCFRHRDEAERKRDYGKWDEAMALGIVPQSKVSISVFV